MSIQWAQDQLKIFNQQLGLHEDKKSTLLQYKGSDKIQIIEELNKENKWIEIWETMVNQQEKKIDLYKKLDQKEKEIKELPKELVGTLPLLQMERTYICMQLAVESDEIIELMIGYNLFSHLETN